MLDRLGAVGNLLMRPHGRFVYAYSAFLGVLSALAFPPYPFIPLFFVAIIGVLLLLGGEKKLSRTFLMGLWFGFGQFGFSLSWITQSFYAQSDVPTWLAPIMVGALVILLSFFYAVAFVITRMLWHKYWFQRALAFSGLYAAAEFARSWETLLAFPWNPASLVWWPSSEMFQFQALGGSIVLGLLTVLAAGLITPIFDGSERRSFRLGTPLFGALLLSLMLGYGVLRLWDQEPGTDEGGPVIRLVQGNIPQLEKWDTEYLRRNLERYLSLSQQPGGALGDPDVVIWPETAVPYDLENQPTRQFIADRLPLYFG